MAGRTATQQPAARDLLAGADRLVVDGSSWSGDGLARLREMAELVETTELAVSDFALVRQSRWREAIASIFDDQDFLPYLRSLRRIAVTYSTHDETGAPGSTNLVKPVYHVGWLASRLGLTVHRPLAPVAGQGRAGPRHGEGGESRGMGATLSDGRGEVAVVVRPVLSATRPARPCGSRSSPNGAARSCAPTSPPRRRRSMSASGRTGWRPGPAFPGAAPDRDGAARRGDRDGPADPVAVGALRSAAAIVAPAGSERS